MLFALRLILLSIHVVIISISGLILGVFRPFNPSNSYLCARAFSMFSLKILNIKLKKQIIELPKTPCVIIANHQSNYDLYIFGSIVPDRTVSLGKKSLAWIPLFGQTYWLAGNILLDRKNPRQAKQAIAKTIASMQRKNMSIWVFPEGTRNNSDQLLSFKRGAFQIAIQSGMPILPICSSRYTRSTNFNHWNSGMITIKSLPLISTKDLTLDDAPELMRDCRERMQICIDSITPK